MKPDAHYGKLCPPRRLPRRSRRPPLNVPQAPAQAAARAAGSTDLLILCDGTVLAHNLTPEMALVLKKLHEPPD